MARSIYRSEAGRDAIRTWCDLRLHATGAPSRDLDTALGTTRITMVGDGPDVVLLPGTNFSTATSLELLALVGREHRAIGIDLPGQPGLSAGNVPAIATPTGRGSASLSTRSASTVQSSWAIPSPGVLRCSPPGAVHRSGVSCSSTPPA
jgi:hypothetical protein